MMNHRSSRSIISAIDDSAVACVTKATRQTECRQAMASNVPPPSSSDYDFVDLSEEDKIAAQKYLNENGVRGLEGFLAERLEAWRKWFVSVPCDDRFLHHSLSLSLI